MGLCVSRISESQRGSIWKVTCLHNPASLCWSCMTLSRRSTMTNSASFASSYYHQPFHPQHLLHAGFSRSLCQQMSLAGFTWLEVHWRFPLPAAVLKWCGGYRASLACLHTILRVYQVSPALLESVSGFLTVSGVFSNWPQCSLCLCRCPTHPSGLWTNLCSSW